MSARSCCLTAVVMLALGGSTLAEDKAAAKPSGPLCPISGKAVDLKVKTMTDDGPVFFCCEGCSKKFTADPAKYKEQVAAQRKALAHLPKVQETCPLSGKPISKEAFVQADGKKVYFCCKGCSGKYEADPAKYKAKLAGCYTYMNAPTCPVSGKPADLARKLATDDGAVYFCCGGCEKAYKADPAKYADKVAEQRKALAAMDRVQVICPLSGKPANPKVFAEVNWEKVAFCCEGCKGKYEADPAKYQARLDASYSYQTLCPVMDEAISPKAFVDLADGRRIYFCCQECEKELLKDPAKYAPKLEEQGVRAEPEKLKAKPAA